MSRDIFARVELFAEQTIEIRRIALNRDQVQEHNLPPSPAKATDSRYEGYRKVHGDDSWELDALSPSLIDKLITDEIYKLRDVDAWEKAVEHEKSQLDLLSKVSGRWGDVAGLLVNEEIPAELRQRMEGKLRESLLQPAPENQYGEYY
jgi:hypothetical protein